MTTWFIRAENGTLCPMFLDKGIASIGGSEIGDPRQYKSKDELITALKSSVKAKSSKSYSIWAGFIKRIRDEVVVGDRVVTYDPAIRVYHMGEVTSGFEHNPSLGTWPNYVRVSWTHQVSRDDLTPNAKAKLGSIATMFQVAEETVDEMWDLAEGRREPYDPSTAAATGAQLSRFLDLYKECTETYFKSEQGRTHLARYAAGREEGMRNFERALQARDQGLDYTDLVLNGLLPHNDTPDNRQRGAWIMLAPVFKGSVKAKYEGAGWHTPEDWPIVAEVILDFITTCYDDPGNLESAIDTFLGDPQSKGFQIAALTPILNAVRPDDFLIFNLKSRLTLHYLTGVSFKQKLVEYPAANEAQRALIEDVQATLADTAVEGIPHADLFDCFSHWLVAIKKVDPKRKYWTIGGIDGLGGASLAVDVDSVGIGSVDIGDLAEMSSGKFRKACAELANGDDPLVERSLASLWKLKKIKPGDGIIVVADKRKVQAIGTASGIYEFDADRTTPHQVPIAWDEHSGYTYPHKGWELLVSEIKPDQFEEALCSPSNSGMFTNETFEYLQGLADNPTKAFYADHKEELTEAVIKPMRDLFQTVVADLDSKILEHVETSKNTYSRIPKNDYGQGGAWSFYWAAGYPYGGDRMSSPQLYIFIDAKRLKFGFSCGSLVSKDVRERFLERVREYNSRHAGDTPRHFPDDMLVIIDNDHDSAQPLTQWLGDPQGLQIDITRILEPHIAIDMSRDDLAESVRNVFKAVFDFFVLAYHDDPWSVLETDISKDNNEHYPLNEMSQKTGFPIEDLAAWLESIERKKQCVLYGPPGTGKTFMARHLARHLIGGDDGISELVQFHPAYSYEDFMIGLRPVTREDGSLEYRHVPGRFLDFCERARTRSGTCVLVIDEINRANLARVFGELMFLLEYRDESVPLASGKSFKIPKNVRIIGTMNTADRSIALVDHALRRRFAFLPLKPQFEVLQNFHEDSNYPIDALVDLLLDVNKAIDNANYHIGTSFFLVENLEESIQGIWKAEIEPYLEEYFFDQPARVEQFKWVNVAKGLAE